MEIKELLRQSKEIKAQISKLEIKHDNLQQKIFKAFFDKKLYCPLSTLKNYLKWDINSIKLVLETGEVLNIKYRYQHYIELESIYISDNGNLEISTQDYYVQNNVIYEQDTKIEIGKIVGYYDLILREKYSQKSVRETRFNYLVNQYLKGDNNDV